MNIRNSLRAGASTTAFAIAALTLPSVAFAQDADEPDAQQAETDADDEDDNVIIVSGFRASLESAVSEKRDNDVILESVTAEDIGRLPDASIGESIARLPGVTSQRLNGRANVISIRGLGPDFSQTILNGREQTSTGDSRSVEFDQYPSEIVNQVVVYKTPAASLVGQGLVGTIDIRTIRPLEVNESVLAIGGRVSYADLGALNAGSDDIGYRANATFVDQFADDTVGVALAVAYTNEPYQLQEFNAWGYAGNGQPGSPYVIGGNKSFVTSTGLERIGFNGTVQAELSSNLMLTVDGFYSNFSDEQFKRGIELPLGFGGGFDVDPFDPSTGTVDGGFATSGEFTDVRGVVRNDIFEREADLYSGGVNLAWENNDGWSAFLDFGYSRTDRNELSIESYSGTGYNGDGFDPQGDGTSPSDTIRFVSDSEGTSFDPTLDYSDPNLIVLTDPLGWGGDPDDGGRVQAGYFNNRIIDDELFQYRIGVSRELWGWVSAVHVGFNYTDRDKSLTPDEFFVQPANGAREVPIPSQFLQRSTDLGYLGLGPIVSYDVRDIIDAGVLTLSPNLSNDIPAKAYAIAEDLYTGYFQFDIERDIGAGMITGNIGVQAVYTEQESSGVAFAAGQQVDVVLGDRYWDVLPSMNLSVRLDSDWVFRLAASRQIQRARLDSLRSAIGYGLNNNPADSPTGQIPFISGGGGNPTLRPYRANAIDFNVERYFGGGSGVVALQLFYKDIENYIANGRTVFNYAGFPLPAGQPPATLVGTLDAPVNTSGGDFYGVELSTTIPFDIFTSALEGFGVTGGVGWTETKIEDFNGNIDAIPGYSEWVANGTAYYERGGFNIRGSVRYRSEFLADFSGFGGNIVRRVARPETIVDAQIGYEFEGGALDGLNIYLNGSNLTNTPFVSEFDVGDPRAVIDYQEYGRRFQAGFTYRF
ncbi:TonB-dependent receptor [Aurantiacibacter gangjinensis]|uniref:TonB-dependent receptor n=1 Tax=Aurantiacibacter gangjinensis TaxID=502682 RepID=A0A0G9MS13_9SPHN|nr:TonB-dependent receptor [Aurantiacibacter gangjinensis]APE26862.1 putative maltose-specific TonB-dependent receptor [Aurantiacibacter gangjinensis]KLE33334.1 TonB-dependent receptor [Aurantiacibacter gangjinensis]